MKKQKFTLSKLLWLFMVLANVLFANSIYAAIKTTRNGGPWTTADNWEGGALPASTDHVVIKHFMTLGSDVTCASLSIVSDGSDGRLTISAGVKVTVTGAVALGGKGIEMLTTSSEASSLIFNSISGLGNLYFGRYVSGTSGSTKNWHIVSSPVTTLSIPGFLSNAYGIVETNNDESLYAFASYNESKNKWNYYSTTDGGTWSGLFNPGQGYTIAMVASGQITIQGRPSTGNVSVGIVKSTGLTPPPGGWGWNALGNPYTASLSTNSFYATNSKQLDPVYGGLYVWDPSSQSYDIITRGTDDYIQMGQGFVVRSNDGGGSISFTYAMRVHSPGTPFKSANITNGVNQNEEVEVPKLVLKANAGNVTRKTSFVFLPDMTTGLDPYYDAGLLAAGGGMDIYSRLIDDKGVNFGLQALPVSGFKELVIPVLIDLQAASSVTFSPDFINLPEGFNVTFEDRLTGIVTLLTQDGAKYTVSLPSNTVGLKRFYLHVRNQVTGSITRKGVELNVFAANKKITIKGNVDTNSKAFLYNLTGSRVAVFDLKSSDLNVLSADQLNSGMYIIQVIENKTQKFTGKIILD